MAVALLLLLPIEVFAQTSGQTGRIRGLVNDVGGRPASEIPVVLVRTPDFRRQTSTDEAGRFVFDGLDPGRYVVRVTGSGVAEATREVVLTSGAQVDVSVNLMPAFAEQLIVTASRGLESLITAPASVSVVGGRDIAASPATSVPALLGGVPGLNVMQIGARDVNINARGASGVLANRMLVMVDGRSVFQPLFGATYWDLLTVDKADISQIEVLRTPASAQWGANALNGVINIRSKSPRETPGLRAQIGAGEIGARTASFSWSDARPGFSYRLAGSYFKQNPWTRDNTLPDGSPMPAGVIFENRGTEQPKLDVRVDWDGQPDRTWSLRGGLAGASGLVYSALSPNEFSAGSYFSYLEVERASDDTDFKAYWNRLDAPFRILLYGLDETAVNDTFVAELTRRLRVGSDHRLVVGGQARLDRFDISIAPGDELRVDASVFAEDTWSVSSQLDLVLGGRVEKFDPTRTVFAPRLGLTFTPVPGHSMHLVYNRSYRAPSILENYVDVDLPVFQGSPPVFLYQFAAVGSTELEMETLDAVEAGYIGVIGPRTTVFATVYRQYIENNIRFYPVSFHGPDNPIPGWPFDPSTAPIVPERFTFLNVGRIRDQGLELATRAEWPSLTIDASYALQAEPLILESGPGGLPVQLNRPPRHQGGATVSYFGSRWTGSLDVRYTGSAFWSDVLTEEFWGDTQAFTVVNVRLSAPVGESGLALWVNATNLLNERIKSHVFSDTVERQIMAGISWRLQ